MLAVVSDRMDAKARKEINLFSHSYKATMICDQCCAQASYRNADKNMNDADFTSNAAHRLTSLTHETFMKHFSPSPFSQERSFANSGMTRSLAEPRPDAARFERAKQALEADKVICHREVASLSKHRKESLLRRGQMLLDQSVLSDLDLD